MSAEQRFAKDMLKSFVSRVENIESEVKELNSDKSDIYKEARSQGFDVKALKAVIALRRKDPNEVDEHNAIVDLYLSTLNGQSETGTDPATRVRAQAPINPPVQKDDDMPPFLDRRSRANAEEVFG